MTGLNNEEVDPITITGEQGRSKNNLICCTTCPSCGYQIKCQNDQQQPRIKELPGLPAGVKFDPTDQELLLHLEGKVPSDDISPKLVHPLIDEFIPTIQGDNGICYTHPQKLPGVKKDGLVRHFFHRPSKAYTTGTRKRRKIDTVDADGGETRWHKTGKTRPVFTNGKVKGYKKILVLYTNYGKQRKPEKTNWVMHQYHLGNNEEEKDGELVVSKVFYQTQPRQCGGGTTTTTTTTTTNNNNNNTVIKNLQLPSNLQQLETNFVDHHQQYCNPSFISFDNHGAQNGPTNNPQTIPHFSVHNGAFLSSNTL